MIFPITDLLDDVSSSQGIAQYFHPQGFRCPSCQSGVEQARVCRHSKRGLVDYRCQHCARVYNLYSGTVFAGCGLSARQTVFADPGRLQRGEPCHPGRGTGGVSEPGASLTAEAAGQRLDDVGSRGLARYRHRDR